MGKKVICFFVILSFAFMFESVKAEECSYKDKAELNKLAANVTASYEVKQDENGNKYFAISIYNITDELYVNVTEDKDVNRLDIISAYMTNNGVFTFNDTNTSVVKTYTFTVRTNRENCTHDIRKFKLIKPKYNKFHDYDECKFDGTEDFKYCSEWITSDFSLSEKKILAKIEEQRKALLSTSSEDDLTDELRQEISQKKSWSKEKKITIYVIIGLMVLDIVLMIIQYIRIKRTEI